MSGRPRSSSSSPREQLITGLAGPIERPSFTQLSYFVLSYRVLSELDLAAIRRDPQLEGFAVQPGVMAELFLLLMTPYTARLYADGQLTIRSDLQARRLASTMFILGSPELAERVVERQLQQQSEVAEAHWHRAYLALLAGEDGALVERHLRAAHALGYDLPRHRSDENVRRVLDTPGLQELFREKD